MTEYFPTTAEGDFRGGIEARAFYLTRHLAARGHGLTILTSHQPGQPRDAMVGGTRVFRVGRTRPYVQEGSIVQRLTFVRSAAAIGTTMRADVVTGCSFLGYLPAWWAAERTATPCVADCHDVWLGRWIQNVGLLNGLAGEAWERFALSRSWTHFVANTGATKGRLRTLAGIPDARITVLPNGITWETCAGIEATKAPQPTVAYVGRLVRYKHIDHLLEAAVRLRAVVPNLRVQIVGTGPERANLERLTGSLGLQGHVEFLGFLPAHRDVLRAIKRAHVLCLPSTVEGFGMAVLEAMALGVPYVAADIPAVREATGGQGGVMVPPHDVSALADALAAILTESIALKPAQDWARQFDWAVLAARLEEIYERLV